MVAILARIDTIRNANARPTPVMNNKYEIWLDKRKKKAKMTWSENALPKLDGFICVMATYDISHKLYACID